MKNAPRFRRAPFILFALETVSGRTPWPLLPDDAKIYRFDFGDRESTLEGFRAWMAESPETRCHFAERTRLTPRIAKAKRWAFRLRREYSPFDEWKPLDDTCQIAVLVEPPAPLKAKPLPPPLPDPARPIPPALQDWTPLMHAVAPLITRRVTGIASILGVAYSSAAAATHAIRRHFGLVAEPGSLGARGRANQRAKDEYERLFREYQEQLASEGEGA